MSLLRVNRSFHSNAPEGGFSMVEMLMVAFIMGVGILGLTMLQTMALRTNTGSRSLTSAVMLADRVLDQAEVLGRNSLLWSRSKVAPPALNPNYFGAANLTQYYKYDGSTGAVGDYFTVTVAPTDVVASVSGVGGIKLITVSVTWSEAVNASKVAVSRNVVLSRRISYANT